MTTVIKADDQASFQREVLDSSVPVVVVVVVVVDFWAAWCGPCRMVGPEVEALAAQYGSLIKVVKVDVDANQSVANTYGIRGIPTIGLFEGGQLITQVVGPAPVTRSRRNWAWPASPQPRRSSRACHRDDDDSVHGGGRSGRA